MLENNENDNKNDQFDFIKEKIKNKPFNKRRLVKRLVSTIAFSALFGLIACFVFVALKPLMEEWIYPQESKISIPKDNETDKEAQVDSTQATESKETETQAPVYITETQKLELPDYQALQTKLYQVGETANKSIVTVTGVSSDTDWFNSSYEKQGQGSGVIIAKNDSELLILTEKKVIVDAQAINVTFTDGVQVSATLKKYDGNTGVAILSVPVNTISTDTLSAISVATLGNSYSESKGSVVIAVGSPLGTVDSIITGDITSTENVVSTFDVNYSIFTTDMLGNSDGNGVLINLQGEIVGLIMQDYAALKNQNTLTAVSISDLKEMIERMSNNQDVPYLGLKLSTVTDDISQKYDVPKGVYISSVNMDSPAMAAGLQSGDVIVEMDHTPVTSVDDYTQKLYTKQKDATIRFTVKRQGTNGYTKINCTATVGVLQ